MNGGSIKGQADGFDIEFMFEGKTTDIKGTDGKNMMHYVVNKCIAEDP